MKSCKSQTFNSTTELPTEMEGTRTKDRVMHRPCYHSSEPIEIGQSARIHI